MFLAFWYYLHGYDMIEVSGFSVERFVNMAAFRGVYLWDICPSGSKVRMKATKDGRGVLKECAGKTGCTIELVGKKGLPSFLKRYEKRKILAAGVLFFVIGLYALSSFIWEVRIKGNERLSQAEVLAACEKMGLAPGVLRMRVDTEAITDHLAEQFSDISWVSVNITGTNATISLVETIPKPEMMDLTVPCDIVASKNGVVQSIAVETGTPNVLIGDVVEKGDVLISSEVIIKDGDLQVGAKSVRARGRVYGKLWHQLEEELPLKYTQKEYTGKVLNDHSLLIHNSVLNVMKPKTSDSLYDVSTEYENELSIGDYQLGTAWKKEVYKEYREIPMERTVDEAKEELKKTLTAKAKVLEEEDGEVLDIGIQFQEQEDKVIATATIAATERLDEEKNIQNESDTIINE